MSPVYKLQDEQFGPLKKSFEISFEKGYNVLIGENNSGKSSILQFIFSEGFGRVGAEKICYLPSERDYIAARLETGGMAFRNYNQSLYDDVLGRGIIKYESIAGPNINQLPRLLLNHHDYSDQLLQMNKYLEKMGFPKLVLKQTQEPHFEDIVLQLYGTGLRSLFYILAALTDKNLEIILIDEPERSLEPRIQKKLKDLLREEGKEKAIIVATHSHLFLDEKEVENNTVVEKNGDKIVSTRKVSDEKELLDITFDLLGSNTRDLFFPNNFLITEGLSDQIICEKVARLLDLSSFDVKIMSANGIEKTGLVVNNIESALRPLIADYSPYSKRVVTLIDAPNKDNKKFVIKLQKNLGKRLFVLTKDSMEDYLPEGLYKKASLNKKELIEKIKKASNIIEINNIKKEISSKIATVLSVKDLGKIDIIKNALKEASKITRVSKQ